jgi:hypothetical protein
MHIGKRVRAALLAVLAVAARVCGLPGAARRWVARRSTEPCTAPRSGAGRSAALAAAARESIGRWRRACTADALIVGIC